MIAHVYHLLLRPPTRLWFSDTLGSAVDDFYVETGLWWQYELTAE